MNASNTPGRLTRRSLLLGGAGAATIIAFGHGGGRRAAAPAEPLTLGNVQLAADSSIPPDVHLAATDGWVNIARPGAATDQWMQDIAPFWPDTSLVPGEIQTGANLYVFGFRNVTGLSDADVIAQRGRAQISAPQLGFKQIDKSVPATAPNGGYRVKLSNLGLQIRPDLVDGHTIHWHGFVNAIPMFDGVPELSFSVPIGRSFTYFYRPYDPGTYMYHCHFEDVEHVQMGMTGLIFVTPLQDGQSIGGFTKFVFNDGDGSTGYDRQFGLFQTEIFAEGHYRDAHIQTTDWTNFKASFWALNGRTYPDTVQPNAPVDTDTTHTGRSRGYDPLEALKANPAAPLAYQPQSALVTCNEGERVLLRMANLGYQSHAMTMDGIEMTIVGKDAWQLKSPDTGAHQYIKTNTVDVNSGESRDVLFTAPAFDAGSAITDATTGKQYNSYLLYDRNYAYASNAGRPGMTGGMVTQVLVFPAGTLGDQGPDANKHCLPDGFAVETIA